MNAVITAGGRVGDEFAREVGTSVKALARVRGRSLLERAIDAARGAGARRIAVIGGDEVRDACGNAVDVVIAESADGAENVRRALHAWPDDEALLYLTSDMPYARAEDAGAFLQRVPEGTLAMALCSLPAFERRFPNASAFGVRIGGEHVVNGGVFLLPPRAAWKVETVAVRLFAARKSPAHMVRLTGIPLAVAHGLGRLNIHHIERRARRLFGFDALAVRDCAPELSFDIDVLEEYRYACAHD